MVERLFNIMIFYYDILSGLVTFFFFFFFRKLPGMQRFQHFLFTSASPGVVQALELLVALFKNSSYFWQVDLRLLLAIEKIKALSFPVLMPPPMKYERQDYLYNSIFTITFVLLSEMNLKTSPGQNQ
jgi:hypothetical protein